MTNGQVAFTMGAFVLLVFALCFSGLELPFWRSVLCAVIFGPICWLIGGAQTVVTNVGKKK